MDSFPLKISVSISVFCTSGKMMEFLIKENSKKETPLIIEAPYQLSEVLSRFHQSNIKESPVSTNDLKREINRLKFEIVQIKRDNNILSQRISVLEKGKNANSPIEEIASPSDESPEKGYLNLLERVTSKKWFVKITLVINKDFILEDEIALIDSGADLNCIQEGIIPTKYFEKITQSISHAGGNKLQVKYKLMSRHFSDGQKAI